MLLMRPFRIRSVLADASVHLYSLYDEACENRYLRPKDFSLLIGLSILDDLGTGTPRTLKHFLLPLEPELY